jgi:hypothetical protein
VDATVKKANVNSIAVNLTGGNNRLTVDESNGDPNTVQCQSCR